MPVLEGTSKGVLAARVGHYDTTAGPGAIGNYALAAHRITHGEPFRKLPDLQAGDLVYVDTADQTYAYKMVTSGDDLRSRSPLAGSSSPTRLTLFRAELSHRSGPASGLSP